MKSKLEIKIDNEFNNLGIKVRIYHFTEPVFQINAITIVTNNKKWNWKRIADALRECLLDTTEKEFNQSTELLSQMATKDFYGIAICNRRDSFNRQRGRIIAKGRLLKYLKKKEK
ncbi:MAG: hypothetical protein KAT65_05165 [Methanophagales archaeon]|nr:hypothetical protein [Methanophagales archaeon]